MYAPRFTPSIEVTIGRDAALSRVHHERPHHARRSSNGHAAYAPPSTFAPWQRNRLP